MRRFQRKSGSDPRRRTRRRRRVDERGVALILVMGAITVLTVFLTQLQEETSSELSAALSERDALKAEYFARSAVNLSRLLIASEKTISDAVGPIILMLSGGKGSPPQIPVWEFTDLVLGPFNDAVSSNSFLATIGADAISAKNIGIAGGGRFEVTIVDEDAKINANLPAQNDSGSSNDRFASQLLGLMTPPQYDEMFNGRDADGQFSDRQSICAAMVDWADSEVDGNEQQYPCNPQSTQNYARNAEDNFYQTIGLPYQRKNGAYDSLEELRLIRGVSDDFWASFVDPEPDNPKKRIMTVWGQNGLNVNAANAQTLLAFVCGQSFAQPPELCTDVTQMTSFLGVVTMAKSLTMGLPVFGAKKDFTDMMGGKGQFGTFLTGLGVKPVTFKNPKAVQDAILLKSHRFSIYADGIVPGYKRTTKVRIHAVVDYKFAGQLGAAGTVIVGGGQAAMPPTGSGASGSSSSGSSSGGASSGSSAAAPGSPDAIMQQLNSNPAGTVIYWRVE